jgi:hypothetical protein
MALHVHMAESVHVHAHVRVLVHEGGKSVCVRACGRVLADVGLSMCPLNTCKVTASLSLKISLWLLLAIGH